MLYLREFEWDDGNRDHVARHAVSPEEAEQACVNARRVLRGRPGRYAAYGQTEAGRYLAVILIRKAAGLIRIITAREMDEHEKRWARHL